MRGRSGGFGVAHLGLGGFLVLLVLSWVSGTNLFSLLGTGDTTPTQTVGTSGEVPTSPSEERMVDFVNAVTKDAQDTWSEILGPRYERTRVVLFRDAITRPAVSHNRPRGRSIARATARSIWISSFFNELSQRFGAPGDFAQAYVITHELGHHVQNLTGLNARASRDRQAGPDSASVALELQADCFAGVWGHAAAQNGRFNAGGVELEPGDVDEALRAAASIGDDRLQKMATGRVMPERFTHGSSAQRVEWFRRGMESGDPRACSTGSTTY